MFNVCCSRTCRAGGVRGAARATYSIDHVLFGVCCSRTCRAGGVRDAARATSTWRQTTPKAAWPASVPASPTSAPAPATSARP